ncbi:hypothetical protein D9O50_01005 [Oxalobacteraceae bacterium CAVE-383]|nr:hypothetical protein D9O50_01005 [Oxalobacteraceae bacterium CAVE-383]
MALSYQPRIKSIVMCDFAGFNPPEMVKVRPVVVLTKHRHNAHLVTVIPLSTTPPIQLANHHHELSVNPLPGKKALRCWAKCDMIYTLSTARMDRFKTLKRNYISLEICEADFIAIKTAVLAALKLS